jgi:hypothetical protein
MKCQAASARPGYGFGGTRQGARSCHESQARSPERSMHASCCHASTCTQRYYDMIAWVCTAGALVGVVILISLGDLASKEIQGRLGLIPQAILWVASRWLDPARRVTLYKEKWLPELTVILRGAESIPFTRLLIGIRFALRIVVALRRVKRQPIRVPHHPQLTTWVRPDSVNDLMARRVGTPPPLRRVRSREDSIISRSIRQAETTPKIPS